MNKIIFLGTGAAVANSEHRNAHLLVLAGEQLVLIDCPENPIPHAQAMGIDLTQRMTHVVLTHFHADHVSGLAVMLQTAWLLGRRQPLPVYGLDYTLVRARKLVDLFEPEGWRGMFPVEYRSIPETEMHILFETPDLRVQSSPGAHLIPNIALRFDFKQSGRSALYTSDTEPTPMVTRLAQGVDALIHETAGPARGHTSPAQAGEIARQAGAGKLYLIHYQTWERDPSPLAAEAQQAFGREVILAEDGMEIDLSSSA